MAETSVRERASLRERINGALREAMLSRDPIRTSTLRLMLAAIRDRDIARRSEEGAEGIGDDEIRALLQRMIRQREESAAAYEAAGRTELAEGERAEIEVIREFLPRPMTAEEIDRAVAEAIRETGASSIRDMGKVMGVLKEKYAGRMDFAEASRRVKAALA